MSRPLKLKAIGACLSAFELPDLGLLGLFAGAHRRRFPFHPSRGVMLISRTSSVSRSSPVSRRRSFSLPSDKVRGIALSRWTFLVKEP
jgi:hypothetical protein